MKVPPSCHAKGCREALDCEILDQKPKTWSHCHDGEIAHPLGASSRSACQRRRLKRDRSVRCCESRSEHKPLRPLQYRLRAERSAPGEITTEDGKTYSAKVIGTDARTDVALIKVEGRSDFPYVKLADHAPRIGDWVLAVGNPFGLGGTVTAGIVSARGRDIGAGPYDDLIQIDAPVNKGNSGGPTFDVDGNVIGVNTAIFSPSGRSVGIAFAIPADTVKSVVAQLRDKGSVTRGWIGVQIQPLTPDLADSMGPKN